MALHKKLFKVGSIVWGAAFATHFSPEKTSIGWLFVIRTSLRTAYVVMVGWGFDEEHPLRPWPWASVRRERSKRNLPWAKGLTGGCLSLCGLFVNVRVNYEEVDEGGASLFANGGTSAEDSVYPDL